MRSPATGASADFALEDVTILRAVPSPLRKVLCVGLNYRDHGRSPAAQ